MIQEWVVFFGFFMGLISGYLIRELHQRDIDDEKQIRNNVWDKIR